MCHAAQGLVRDGFEHIEFAGASGWQETGNQSGDGSDDDRDGDRPIGNASVEMMPSVELTPLPDAGLGDGQTLNRF